MSNNMEQEPTIEEVQLALRRSDQNVAALLERIAELEGENSKQQETIVQQDSEIVKLKDRVTESDKTELGRRAKIDELQKKLRTTGKAKGELETQVEELQKRELDECEQNVEEREFLGLIINNVAPRAIANRVKDPSLSFIALSAMKNVAEEVRKRYKGGQVPREQAVRIVAYHKRNGLHFKECESLIIALVDSAHSDFELDDFITSCKYLFKRRQDLNDYVHGWRPTCGKYFDANVSKLKKEKELFGGEETALWSDMDSMLDVYEPSATSASSPQAAMQSGFQGSSVSSQHLPTSLQGQSQYGSRDGYNASLERSPHPWYQNRNQGFMPNQSPQGYQSNERQPFSAPPILVNEHDYDPRRHHRQTIRSSGHQQGNQVNAPRDDGNNWDRYSSGHHATRRDIYSPHRPREEFEARSDRQNRGWDERRPPNKRRRSN